MNSDPEEQREQGKGEFVGIGLRSKRCERREQGKGEFGGMTPKRETVIVSLMDRRA
jgi:hypothetical protein